MRTLRYWRRVRLMTQRELAEAVGVSWQTVSEWERGTQEPFVRHLRKLCQVLDVRPEALLGGPDEQEKAAA